VIALAACAAFVFAVLIVKRLAPAR